jgi:hypothetical protein
VSIDTVGERGSAIHVGLPWRGMFPMPTGDLVINGNERAHIAGFFAGHMSPAITSTAVLHKPVDYVLAGDQHSFKSGRARGRAMSHAFGEE